MANASTSTLGRRIPSRGLGDSPRGGFRGKTTSAEDEAVLSDEHYRVCVAV